MLKTAEMRWFYTGKVPENVQHWFEKELPGDNLRSRDTREDVYLWIPQCEFLGVKHRESRLEIKWRQQALGKWPLSDRIVGNAEIWIKWLCVDPESDTMLPTNVMTQPSWIGVQKQRQQRIYTYPPEQQVQPAPADEWLSSGGGVELTQLRVANQDWWTLGIEVFGEGRDLLDVLQAIATIVTASYPGETMTAQHSFGYPAWLAKL
jgi:hypothetical protein